MKFEYLAVAGLKDSRGKMVKRPVLMLELKAEDGSVLEVPALVDSGADTTTVNIQYAEALGIRLGEEGAILGIAPGKVKRRMGHLLFKIKHTDFELDVPAWYVDSENVGVLLGQEAFFDTFKIKFEKSRGVFEINPVKDA
jgi:predicted aspartyl protease